MKSGILQDPIQTARCLRADQPDDVRVWDALIDESPARDVYYRPGYARAYQEIGNGRAVAVLVESDRARALFPLLLRPLSELSFAPEDEGFDAATPYGYGGCAFLDKAGTEVGRHSAALLEGLRDWCRENHVVSAHMRLHPVFRQEEWFQDLPGGMGLHLLAPTTALDLSKWNPETASISTLNKGRRSDLSFARRSLRLTWTSDGRDIHEDLRTFYDLYEQRMTELQAGDYYHFDFAYYAALADGLGPQLETAIAWLGDQPVGAALFMSDRLLSHYHLSATNALGRSHKATTLILNGAAERARQRGCRQLHLGGGARGEDKLLEFKQSFGGDRYRYSYLSIVCDPARYAILLERRMTVSQLPPARPHYFPEYRA